jgi:NifU-like protein
LVQSYPNKIKARANSPRKAGRLSDASAIGTSASFQCGSFIELSLSIDATGVIADAGFQSNGCGYMVATADALCEWLTGNSLAELHGLAESELHRMTSESLGDLPTDRNQCAEVTYQALRRAMAAYRDRRIEEFQGERALICTCFGVSEDTIVGVIAKNKLTEVDEVSEICRAGSGCGSCRMLIQELIDSV